jgi:hypothetical protein
MYPVGTSVRLSVDDDVLDGATAFIMTDEGDWTDDGERVPTGHVQVEARLVDPEHGGIKHRTIIESTDIDEVFC